jgi:hypothetical protein
MTKAGKSLKKQVFCIKYRLTFVIGTKKEGSHANVNCKLGLEDVISLLEEEQGKSPIEEGSHAIVYCKLGLGQVVSPMEEEQRKQQGSHSRGKPCNCQL